jgi:hypothetical protein
VSSIGLILFSILSILSFPLFKLSAPQDLPSRCVSPLHLPLPASYGIFKTFLKTLLFHVGLDLYLVLVPSFLVVVEGYSWLSLGGSVDVLFQPVM